jgi:hypothetical protein
MLVKLFGDKTRPKMSLKFGNICDLQYRYRYQQLVKDKRFPDWEKEAIQVGQKFTEIQNSESAKVN